MMTIWRFPIQPGPFTLQMPAVSTVLSVQVKDGEPCLWGLVDPETPSREWRFDAVPTGREVPYNPREFLGTFQLSGTPLGTLVFHLFHADSQEHGGNQ